MDTRLSFIIRRVRKEDAESIVGLLNPIIESGTYTIIDEPCTIEDQGAFIRGLPGRSIYNIAVCPDTGRALGIQDVVPASSETRAYHHVGEISTFVALDMHRRGIGKSLIEATLRDALSQGFLKIMATIRADNPSAISFYRGQGFRMIGTAMKHAYVSGEYIDEVLMERFLR